MEPQSDSVTTAIPIPSNPAVPSHSTKPFSNNHVDSVEPGDTRIIVCALPASNNPAPGPFGAKRERRTFWTACASCKKKNKHLIEHLNSNISCLQCNETFKATEVSRPRNQHTTTTENVHSGAIHTYPGTSKVEPRKMTPTEQIRLPKRVKREINATQATGKHGYNLLGSFNKDEIDRLLRSKARNKVKEIMNM